MELIEYMLLVLTKAILYIITFIFRLIMHIQNNIITPMSFSYYIYHSTLTHSTS